MDKNSLSTIGLDIKYKNLKRRDDKKIKLVIFDTPGQERFKSIEKNRIKSSDGIILIYDVTNKESFKNIKEWINDIKETIDITRIGIIIVGNKCELTEQKVVGEEIKKKLENNENIKIIEDSSKDNINVNESFILLIDKMIELKFGRKKYFDDKENERSNKIIINVFL